MHSYMHSSKIMKQKKNHAIIYVFFKKNKGQSQIACIQSMHVHLNQEIHIYAKFHALKHVIFKIHIQPKISCIHKCIKQK